MSRPKVYRILIASPGNVPEERQAVADSFDRWNRRKAHKVRLEPVMWETDAVPDSGLRPQAIINRDLLTGCHAAIALLWTKIGTATGVAKSGTVEEVEHFLAAGKSVMLYICIRPVNPQTVDLVQLGAVRGFVESVREKALSHDFTTAHELEIELPYHLDALADRLVAADRPKPKPKPSRFTPLPEQPVWPTAPVRPTGDLAVPKSSPTAVELKEAVAAAVNKGFALPAAELAIREAVAAAASIKRPALPVPTVLGSPTRDDLPDQQGGDLLSPMMIVTINWIEAHFGEVAGCLVSTFARDCSVPITAAHQLLQVACDRLGLMVIFTPMAAGTPGSFSIRDPKAAPAAVGGIRPDVLASVVDWLNSRQLPIRGYIRSFAATHQLTEGEALKYLKTACGQTGWHFKIVGPETFVVTAGPMGS